MSEAAKKAPIYQIPERIGALWCGFAAFVFAFVLRLVASGEVLSALFAACAACLVGAWIGRLVCCYMNSNLLPEETEPVDDDSSGESTL